MNFLIFLSIDVQWMYKLCILIICLVHYNNNYGYHISSKFGANLKISKKSNLDRNQLKPSTQHKDMYYV